MSLRIIGGDWRGRVIRAPEGVQTRPSSARLRESLFNILGQRCDGWKVADLYAGSGAVGLEALSRGASTAVFVENHALAITALKRNFQIDKSGRCSLEAVDALNWRTKRENQHRFDFVFIDPPFTAPLPGNFNWLSLVANRGVLVFQFPTKSQPAWFAKPERIEKYGDSSLAFWWKGEAHPQCQ